MFCVYFGLKATTWNVTADFQVFAQRGDFLLHFGLLTPAVGSEIVFTNFSPVRDWV